MVKRTLIIALTFFKFYVFSQGFYACYNFANVTTTTGAVDPTPVPVVSGLSFMSFTAVGTNTTSGASGRFSFTDWPLGSMNGVNTYSNFTGAFVDSIYYEVKLVPQTTYTLNLESITFTVRRSGTGIRNYCVRSSLDSFSANLNASTGASAILSIVNPNIFFWNSDANTSDQKASRIDCDSTFRSITDTITFRFYAWNAEKITGTFSIDSVAFTGTVTNVFTPPNPVGVINERSSESFLVSVDRLRENILFKTDDKFSSADLLDMYGVQVKSIRQCIPNELQFISISGLPEGIYFLRLTSRDHYLVKRVSLSK